MCVCGQWGGGVGGGELFTAPRLQNFLVLNSAEHEIFSTNKYQNAAIVGIFIFISREIFMLSFV